MLPSATFSLLSSESTTPRPNSHPACFRKPSKHDWATPRFDRLALESNPFVDCESFARSSYIYPRDTLDSHIIINIMSGLDSIAMAVALLEQRSCPQPPAAGPAMPPRAPMLKIVSSEPTAVTETTEAAKEDTVNATICSNGKDAVITTVVPSMVPICCSMTKPDPNMEVFADMPNYANYIFSLDLEELNTIPVPDSRVVILYPGENDILCGRGGETNNHRYVRGLHLTAGTRGKDSSDPSKPLIHLSLTHTHFLNQLTVVTLSTVIMSRAARRPTLNASAVTSRTLRSALSWPSARAVDAF